MSINKFFQTLFSEDQGICYGDFKSYKVRPVPIEHTGAAEFYSINPLSLVHDYGHEDKDWYNPNVPRRADINVSSFQNFIFEMDSHTYDAQIDILNACEIRWTALVYSGGKSVHAILSLLEPLDLESHKEESVRKYNSIWKGIKSHIESTALKLGYEAIGGKFVDPSGVNPSRLTRYPGVLRSSTGKVQELLHLDKLFTPEEFTTLLSKCTVVEYKGFVETVEVDISMSLECFESLLPSVLYSKLKYPHDWAASEGLYPELYKLTLWAIDSTGCGKYAYSQFLEKYTFPVLVKKGYPHRKLRVAINDAFRTKGVR